MRREDTKIYCGILLWFGGANLSRGCGSRNHHPTVFSVSFWKESIYSLIFPVSSTFWVYDIIGPHAILCCAF